MGKTLFCSRPCTVLGAFDFTFPSLLFLQSRNPPFGVCPEILVIYGIGTILLFGFPGDGNMELQTTSRGC